MREIKFRAWNDETKRMCFNVAVKNGYQVTPVQTSGNDSWDAIYEESENIVMQYTGLKDKNGKEIYEGDIMKVLDRDWVDMERDTRTFVVYYAEDAFILTTSTGIKERESENPNTYNKDWIEAKLSREYGRDRFEVIGNIYENPELLAK